MLGVEWDMNLAMEAEREDGREEVARNALAEGASIEFVKKITGFDDKTIRRLQEEISNEST